MPIKRESCDEVKSRFSPNMGTPLNCHSYCGTEYLEILTTQIKYKLVNK